jgi:hypothetical protein
MPDSSPGDNLMNQFQFIDHGGESPKGKGSAKPRLQLKLFSKYVNANQSRINRSKELGGVLSGAVVLAD